MTKQIEKSSGNVFADIGVPGSDQELLKAKFAVQIYKLVKARGFTQAEAAAFLGTTQPQVSALMNLRPASMSVGRLMEFLTILGQDIQVTVKPTRRRAQGQMTVQVGSS